MEHQNTPAKNDKPRLITLSAPIGRWAACKGDLDLDPRDSGFKLRQPLILN